MSGERRSYRHSRDVAWRRVGDEAVVLDLRSSVYYSLNDSAAAIWERLGEGLSPDEVAAAVSEEYGEPLSEVRRDVLELLKDLQRSELLEPRS